jgi:hypothetical protein
MRVAVLLVVLLVAGCGETRRAAAPASLPTSALELVPESAHGSLLSDELRVAECGITPTYPCVRAFFLLEGKQSLDEKTETLRGLAERRGWRVEGLERFAGGAHIDLVRQRLNARYTLGRDIFGPGSMVQLSVFGPAAPIPRPSEAQRADWSAEKREYVRQANAVCTRTLRGLVAPDDIGTVLEALDKRLSDLEPPNGDEAEVRSFLRPLRNLRRAASALTDSEGEDALPAAVGVGEFTKQFVRAASRYGLVECVLG